MYEVKQTFRYGGRTYVPGEQFNPTRTAISKRHTLSLLAAGSLAPSGGETIVSAPESVEEPAPSKPTPVHVGGGWYEVTVGGEVQRVKGKKAAEELVG